MKVIFIFPPSLGSYGVNEFTEQPPLGIAYLSAALLKENVSCEVIDGNLLNSKIKDIVNIVKDKKPDLICLSLFAFNFKAGLYLSKAFKEILRDTLIIIGGAQPSALRDRVFDKSNSIDAVVAGEGELTLLEVIKRKKANCHPFLNVDGLIYREGSSIIKNKPRGRITDLDSFPFPAFHLFPKFSRYRRKTVKSKAAPILTSRGCPFGCIFCSKGVFDRTVYYRSAENVIAEIDYLVERFKVEQIDVVDDNFITSRERAVKILELLCERPYRLHINLQSGVSAAMIDEDMLKLMKNAGVYRIAYGIESGDQGVLDFIKKGQRLEDIQRAVSLTNKLKIRTDGFFMIGLPGDSAKTMRKTIDFAKNLTLDTANFHMVIPFFGTELYNLIEGKGRFLKKTENGINTGYNYPEPFFEIFGLNEGTIKKYYKKAYLEYYFRPRKIIQYLLGIRSFKEASWMVKTTILVIFSMFNRKIWKKNENLG